MFTLFYYQNFVNQLFRAQFFLNIDYFQKKEANGKILLLLLTLHSE